MKKSRLRDIIKEVITGESPEQRFAEDDKTIQNIYSSVLNTFPELDRTKLKVAIRDGYSNALIKENYYNVYFIIHQNDNKIDYDFNVKAKSLTEAIDKIKFGEGEKQFERPSKLARNFQAKLLK